MLRGTASLAALSLVVMAMIALIVLIQRETFATATATGGASEPLCNPFVGAGIVNNVTNVTDPITTTCVYRYHDRADFKQGVTVDEDVEVAKDIMIDGKSLRRLQERAARAKEELAELDQQMTGIEQMRRAFDKTLPRCNNNIAPTRNDQGCYTCPRDTAEGRCTVDTGDTACRSPPLCDHRQLRDMLAVTKYPTGVEVAPAARVLQTVTAKSTGGCIEKCRLMRGCKAYMFDNANRACKLKNSATGTSRTGMEWQGGVIAPRTRSQPQRVSSAIMKKGEVIVQNDEA